jgi:hypothetical protein
MSGELVLRLMTPINTHYAMTPINTHYDYFHGFGDFSHAYIIMHKYFGKKPGM